MTHPACKPLASPPTLPYVFSKRFGRLKRHVMPHHVRTGPGQLVRHRLVSHCDGGLGLLALLIALHSGVEPHGKVGRFRRGPASIGVAMFPIALPLTLAVADFRAVHTATRRGIIPYAW